MKTSWRHVLKTSWRYVLMTSSRHLEDQQMFAGIGLIRKLQNVLPQPALMTICKAFMRPHLDYGNVIYEKACDETFHQKLESIQYDACLALSGAIRILSREKLYQKWGLEFLQRWRWYRKFSLFYKIFHENEPLYLFNLIPTKILNDNIRNTDKITLFRTKHNFYKIFFPIHCHWMEQARS